jgi:hypothetical protein
MSLRIAYVARHGPHDNADEDAIAHALRQLGHEVVCLPEECGADIPPADLLLCHKWYDFAAMEKAPAKAKAFWHFDLIESDDWDLKARSAERVEWMRRITPLVDFGFCTDGDWVGRDTTGKLRWLMQGADERVMGPGTAECQSIDILFAGTQIHGGKRASHIEELKAKYGPRFRHVGQKPRQRLHGRKLADLYASAKIVIAPDGPVTARYWSNRVYQVLGFGGFLLHPYCAQLANFHYTGMKEIVFYSDRRQCEDNIDHFLDDATARHAIAAAGYDRTAREHTYRHRCAELVHVVEGRL